MTQTRSWRQTTSNHEKATAMDDDLMRPRPTWERVLDLAVRIDAAAQRGEARAEDGALLARMVLRFDENIHGKPSSQGANTTP